MGVGSTMENQEAVSRIRGLKSKEEKNHLFQLHRSVGYLQIFLNSQKHFPILRT